MTPSTTYLPATVTVIPTHTTPLDTTPSQTDARRLYQYDDTELRLQRLQRLAHVMDNAFRIPIIGKRIGLDAIIGLVPGIGDLATTGVAAIVVVEAIRMGVPRSTVARMLLNLGIDAALGAIPVIGDLFDIGFKANVRNVELLEQHVLGL